tara:strand:- start:71 stop:832 length:762 start_codon:yes stop_codon:yes gene_type:complete
MSANGLPNPTQLRIKPVYDTGSFGHDVTFPLPLAQATNLATLTPSTASFYQSTHDSALPVDELARFISESDKCELLHNGNDTDFDKTWILQPDMTAWTYKLALNFGVGLKVSAYTSGNVNAGNIHITITEIGDGAGDTVIEDLTIAIGSPNLTATGEQIIMFHADIVRPIKLNGGLPVKVRIQTESSKSGTATYQVGMLPVFPIIPTAVPKTWYESQVELHLHGDLTHAYPIWRSENNQELMDYSGCGSGGCS